MHEVPVLVLVLAVFALVVVASAKKVHLGLAAAIGGVAFALARGVGVPATLLAAGAELVKPDTLLLLVLVSFIMVFSNAMKKAGAMDAFSGALSAIAPSKRIALATAPLIIGTLPMPGGAILSAPLVDAFDPERKRGGDTLSATNYWFRHNLELTWPLYPAFILTSTLSGFSVGKLMTLNLYAPILLFALGLVFILPKRTMGADGRRAGDAEPEGGPAEDAATRRARVIGGFAPLLIVIGSYAALDAAWKFASAGLAMPDPLRAALDRYLAIFIGLGLGCLYVALGKNGKGAFKGCYTLATAKLVAVVAGIRVFSALLVAGGVAEGAAAELAALGIPAVAAAMVLPFVGGLVTGVGFGYVGLTFPIVLGLFPAGGSVPLEAAVVLGGVFGYAGMMISPLHVCMVVTAEHFSSGLPAMIRRFAPPLALFVALGLAYAFLLSRLF